MGIRENILEISKNFHLEISHAVYERLEACGQNKIPLNRIFIILETASKSESYIANHSLFPAQKLTLHPGVIYFMPKDQILEYYFYPGVKLMAFHFSMEVFPGIDLFDGDSMFLKKNAPENLIGKLKYLWQGNDDLGSTAEFYGLIYSMLGMFSCKDLKSLSKRQESMEQFKPLMKYIEENSDAQTTVGELADFCGIPQDTLSKQFVRLTGIPLKTFLTRLLLRKASEQLLSTDFKIREISEKIGFSSEYYFCRFFKKHTGMSPNSYRQSLLN